MAGKQTYEKTRTNKAYAEGRTARFTGKLAGDNPWPVAFEEESVAWAFGFAAPNGEVDDTAYSGLTSPFSSPTPGSLTPGSSPGPGAKAPATDPAHQAYFSPDLAADADWIDTGLTLKHTATKDGKTYFFLSDSIDPAHPLIPNQLIRFGTEEAMFKEYWPSADKSSDSIVIDPVVTVPDGAKLFKHKDTPSGSVVPLPKDQWPAPPNLSRTTRNQLAAWMAVSLYPVEHVHAVRPLLEAHTKNELIEMLGGTMPLPDTSHIPADDPLPPLDESLSK
jgi:hypothetical protein